MSTESGSVPRLGPYRLHGVLGEGGMGVVHLGVDDSGRAVAVKVLRDHVAHDPTSRARLAREVATLRRVDHPAVAPFLGADVEGDRPYVVTRYIAGDPLDRWVADHGPLTGEALRHFGITLADALEAIHRAGVVHRDLKPANVLMPGGSPVVIDFGIAHVADESRLTSTGLVMGTPGYLAPELLDGGDVSGATDLWGYAATLAFAATGRAPFGTGHGSAVLDRVRRGAADLDGVPTALVSLLRSALDPDASTRPELSVMRKALTDRPLEPARTPVSEDGPRTQVLPVLPSDAADTDALQAPPAPRTEAVPRPPRPDEVGPPRPSREEPRASRPPQHTAPATAVNPVIDTRVMPAVPAAPPPRPGYAPFEGRPPQRDGRSPVPMHGSMPSGAASAGGAHPYAGGPVGPSHPGAGPVRPVSRRLGTVAALGLVILASISYLPGLGLFVALGWSWLARFVDRVTTALFLRRAARGVRDRDVPIAILASPWHLLGAGLSAVMTGILPVLVGLGCGVGLHALSGGAGVSASTVALGAAAGLVVAWWGPGSSTLRHGTRSIVRVVAPGRTGAMIAGGLLLSAAAVIGLMTQSGGWRLSWWPLEGLWEAVVAVLPF